MFKPRPVYVFWGLCVSILMRITACGDTPPNDFAPGVLSVHPTGCVNRTADHTCVLSTQSRFMCFWVQDISSDTPLRVHTTDAVPCKTLTVVDNGQRCCLDIPSDATQITFSVDDTPRTWSLEFAVEEECPRVTEVKRLRMAGGHTPEELRKLLDPDQNTTSYCAATALSLKARLYLQENDTQGAIRALKEAADQWAKIDGVGPWLRDIFALSNTWIFNSRRYEDAYTFLHQAAERTAHWAEMLAKSKYYLALLFRETGDIRSTLELVDESILWARRLGMETMEMDALDLKAQILSGLGRDKESETLRSQMSERMRASGLCVAAQWNNNSAWAWLMIHENQQAVTTPDPRPLLVEALETFTNDCPKRRDWWRSNVLVNLALLEIQSGEVASAERFLTLARSISGSLEGTIAEWANEIDARIALSRGDLDRVDQILCAVAWDPDCPVAPKGGTTHNPIRNVSPEIYTLALLGRGLAAWQRQDYSAAERLLLQASTDLEEQTRFVPLGAGKSTFVGSRSKVSRALAKLYVQTGQMDAAAWELRRANAQILNVFQSMDMDQISQQGQHNTQQQKDRLGLLQLYHELRDQADQKHAEALTASRDKQAHLLAEAQVLRDKASRVMDQLADDSHTTTHIPTQPPPGELWLLIAPIGDGWGAIWQGHQTATFVPLPDLTAPADINELAALLLTPVAEILSPTSSSVTHIRVTALGAAVALDVHTLPWEGKPLQSRWVVDYWVPNRHPGSGQPAVNKALIVADPTDNLRHARNFGNDAAHLWKVNGVNPTVVMSDQATRKTILDHLTNSTAFIYAGHAKSGGVDGRNAALMLANEAEISAADLVTKPTLPQFVVLSACQGGDVERESIAPGPGIAQAFLLGGSRMVIASVRPVDDRCAGLWTHYLLENWTIPHEDNLWTAYLSATDRLRTENPDCDAGMFRVYRSPH